MGTQASERGYPPHPRKRALVYRVFYALGKSMASSSIDVGKIAPQLDHMGRAELGAFCYKQVVRADIFSAD